MAKTRRGTEPLPTMGQLTTLYPVLKTLMWEVERFQGNADPQYCANNSWYDREPGGTSLRNRVVEIANQAGERFGWDAYDLIYGTLYNRLPDCRECGCLRREEVA